MTLSSILRKALLSFMIFASFSAARGQWVSVPQVFGQCLLGNGLLDSISGYGDYYMDTTSSVVLNATSIRCNGYTYLNDLTGVQYFKNLDTLMCSGDYLYTYPTLPNTLRYLDLSDNHLWSSIPPLPDSLRYFNCSGNNTIYFTSLSGLPPYLTHLECGYCHSLSTISGIPSTLTVLNCSQDDLNSLPALPSGLTYLNCFGNALTYIGGLPSSLRTLQCSSNPLFGGIGSFPDSLAYVDCGYDGLTSLPTLPDSLTTLICHYNNLSSLPALPSAINSLDCYHNNLTSLPSLPDSLMFLFASINGLSSLPTLPPFLRTLECDNNNLISMPVLPSSLGTLYCNNNNLSSMPAIPISLGLLVCADNQLLSLPQLDSALYYLDCGNNRLTHLPPLPPLLAELFCDSNMLASLPMLPNPLYFLDCYNNQLTSIPQFTPSLYHLDCSHNQLSALPDFTPSFVSLNCSFNSNLSCLPRVYRNPMNDFYIDSTHIQCLPNRFTAYDYDLMPDTMPLCNAVSGCDFYYNIAGNAHNDSSLTCLQDSLHPSAMLRNMKVQLRQNNQVIQQFYTFTSGGYSFKTDSLTSYQITLDTLHLPLTMMCPPSGVNYAALSQIDSVAVNENFGLSCNTNTDFAVSGISTGIFAVSETTEVVITAGNLPRLLYGAVCGLPTSGIVTTIISGPASYSGPGLRALTPSTISGDTLTYIITDLNSLLPGDLNILLVTYPVALRNSFVCIESIITPSVSDGSPGDDTLTQCGAVLSSHDPNIKEVYPAGNIDTGANQWLTYTIHFQNTGTDTAFTVVVMDTLSGYIDASTFEYIASGNNAVIQLFGNVAVFTFPKINLPDSLVNPLGSMGWVQFKVRLLPNLPVGTQINNGASIYFDSNPGVVTNTVTNTIMSCENTYNTAYDTICQGMSIIFYGDTLTMSGAYTDTSITFRGCDSIAFLYLTVNPKYSETIYDTICAGSVFALGSQSLNQGGTYRDTLTTVRGCDSIVTLNLSVRPLSYDTITQTVCAGDGAAFGGRYYYSTGYYSQILTGINGCDSVVTLNLSVMPMSYDTIAQTVCAGDSESFGGSYYHSSGYYSQVLTGVNGCDSMVTLNLSVVPLSYDTIIQSICANDSFVFGGIAYDTGGYYSQTFTGTNGCDSIVTLSLVVRLLQFDTLNQNICQGSTYTFGPAILNTAGTYRDTLTAADGCDSIVTLALIVSTTPATPVISRSGMNIMSSPAAHYQWLMNGLPIPGDTTGFTAISQNGSYSVEVTDTNGCTSISDTVEFLTLGIDGIYSSNIIHIYPDPNSGSFTLETVNIGKAEYVIYDILGRPIRQEAITSGRQQIDMGTVPAGIYSLTISVSSTVLKFVVLR